MRFCYEYIKDLNGTRAAIRAGYSVKSARYIATELIHKPQVAILIKELTEEMLKKCEITTEKTLRELAKIGYFDLNDLRDEKGKFPTAIKDINALSGSVVKNYKINVSLAGKIVKIEMYDKMRALELIGRYQNIFNERVQHEQVGEWKITINKTYDPNEFIKNTNNNGNDQNPNA